MRPEIEQAVQLLQRGDDAALEQALALLQNTVFSFSMRVCGQREDAEDTMQEVLLKSVPHLPKFDSPKALVVWLYKVAKNRCLMGYMHYPTPQAFCSLALQEPGGWFGGDQVVH